jgi:hypothetical protein
MDNHNSDLPQPYVEQPPPQPAFKSNIYRNVCEKAALLLANGNSIAGTAGLCGIHRKTLHQWMHDDHFVTLIEQEKSRLREELLGTIKKASQKPHLWASAAWILERNKAFGDEFKLNKEDKGRGNVVVQIAISHPCLNKPETIDCDIEKE